MSAGRRRVGGGGVGFNPLNEVNIPSQEEWLEIHEKIKAEGMKITTATYDVFMREYCCNFEDVDSICEIKNEN